ncbi:MAG: hypothetical protein AAGA80_18455, partial [Cyanobacteria bacterium P01_F01_bin.143]
MEAKFSTSNQQEFHQEVEKYIGKTKYNEGHEQIVPLHPRIGKGQIRHFEFNSGLGLTIQDYFTQENITLETEVNFPFFGFCWVISGCSNYKVNYQLADKNFKFRPQQQIISYSNNLQCTYELEKNKKVSMVGLSLDAYLHNCYLQDLQ